MEYKYSNNKRNDKQNYIREQNYIIFKKKISIIFCVLIFIALILASPIFKINEININQTNKYTKSELLEKMGISEGMNIFSLNTMKAEKMLESDSYIENCKIKKKLPNSLDIYIDERKVRGYVPYMDSYLYIDEYGRVLDIQLSYTEALPLVKGLDFNEFKIGEILNVKNYESFDIVVKISQLMVKYEMLDLVVCVDVSNPKDIHAYSNNIEILLGDINDYDRKIRIMAQVIKQIPKDDKGTLNLKDLSKPIIFKYLT